MTSGQICPRSASCLIPQPWVVTINLRLPFEFCSTLFCFALLLMLSVTTVTTLEHFPDDSALRTPKKAAIETSTNSVYGNKQRWTDVLFLMFSDILCLIELSDDVLSCEGGTASFAARWPNINLGELRVAQVMYQSHLIYPSTLSSIRLSIYPSHPGLLVHTPPL